MPVILTSALTGCSSFTKLAAVALALPLIIAGCGSSGSSNSIDQRSYDAGHQSIGPELVARGVSPTKACEEALQTDYSYVPSTFPRYDTASFNSGCYAAIRASEIGGSTPTPLMRHKKENRWIRTRHCARSASWLHRADLG